MPPNQKRPSWKKKRAIQTASKRESRGRIYVVAIIIVVIVIGVGWYVYASSQSPGQANTLPDIVYARLSTSEGTIEVELYHSLNPKTVENFVNLANSGFYNNLVWHRINAGFVIQTGDPNTKNGGGDRTTWGKGGSQSVPFEWCASVHIEDGILGLGTTSLRVGG